MDLTNIKILLGKKDDKSEDDVLSVLLTHSIQLINVYLGVTNIPQPLEFIAEQITVKKYNKLGSEGIVTEKLDVISNTYSVDDLEEYKSILDMYKDTMLPQKKTTNKLETL